MTIYQSQRYKAFDNCEAIYGIFSKMVDIKNEDMARNNIEIYLINKINVCY